jgi:hypothetical protein
VSRFAKEQKMANRNKNKQRNQPGSARAGQQSQQMNPSRQQSQQMGQPRQPASDSPRKQFQQQNKRGRGQQR